MDGWSGFFSHTHVNWEADRQKDHVTGPVDTGKHPGSWETGRLTLDTQEGKRFIEDEVKNNNNNHSNEGGSDIGANQGYLQWWDVGFMADHMHHLSLPVLLAGVIPGRCLKRKRGGWLVWLSLHHFNILPSAISFDM
jgi:hypothetical protein